MKKIIIFLFLAYGFNLFSQNIYVKVDTRNTNICDTSILVCPKCVDGENRIYYYIHKTEHENFYEADLRLEYHPFTAEYVKGSILTAHRTRKMSKADWKSNINYRELAIVIDFDWIEHHSWDLINWMARSAKHIYVIDEKYSTKDSIRIREVDYVDTQSQE